MVGNHAPCQEYMAHYVKAGESLWRKSEGRTEGEAGGVDLRRNTVCYCCSCVCVAIDHLMVQIRIMKIIHLMETFSNKTFLSQLFQN